ncbi:MAG: SDR family oxidoreductase [Rhodospirillales bacterium]
MDLGLKGRKAFVTGASRGIGQAIAEALAAEGVSLALFGRDRKRCEALARKLGKAHPEIEAFDIALDLLKPATIRASVTRAIKKLGGLDILVNCAGGAPRGHLEDIPDKKWDEGFTIKPIGLMRMTRECLPYLRKSKQGRIINIAGTRGREPAPLSMMSGPINLGTLSATKALANALGPDGITVNAVNPGTTDTGRFTELVNMTAKDRKISKAEATKMLLREVPMGCVIMPEDIADVTVFLASARAGKLTGVAINVDGGRTRSI